MTEDKAKAKIDALMCAWGWLTYLSEGYDDNELSDNLLEDVLIGKITETHGRLVQEMANHEADIIQRKMWKLRRKYGLENY